MKLGLRSKLLSPTIIAVIVSMALAGFFSAKTASDQLWNELENSSRLLAANLTSAAGSFAGNVRGAVLLQANSDRVRKALTDPTPEHIEDARKVLLDLRDYDESVQGVNVLDAKGEVVFGDDPKAKGNFADRGYFKKAIKGEANISEPVISRVTNKPVFMAAAPIKQGEKILGIIYARVDLAKFSENMVDPVKVGQSGYAYMVSDTGLVFSHPDKETILKVNISETDWGKQVMGKDSGTVSYNWEGVTRTSVFSRDKTTGWRAIISISSHDIEKATGSVRNSSLLFGVLGIALVCAAIVFILNKVLKDLDKSVGFAEAVAAGDLGQTLDMHRDDELGRLSDSLRKMVESLKGMISQAQDKTMEAERQTELARVATEEAQQAKAEAERAKREGMLHAAQQLEGIVEVVTSASTELSSQIEESSRGAENQAARVSETATAMEEMTATVLEVAKNAGEAAETAGSARTKAQSGAHIVSRVVTSMSDVQTQSNQLKDDMAKLGKQAEDIGRIMTVITDIADQTNLLALNAAIEAARAGDAGRGFAVVADEVRKLAEKTMQATKEVGEAIAVIQHSTRVNVENVDKSVRLIETTTGLAEESGAALAEIVSLVDAASDQVRSIATASEEQSSASEEINRSIEEVNIISSETSQAMGEAAKAVSELAEQSQMLQKLIAKLEQDGRG
ncbi:methyl-accepting chemotaxis sensory transducer with Cache sensor [Humidesulfovibrio mexicanus]|uniref:Methyl-accepting chemotaxis sensory transducer with Cache sensor n=1 Tax=Humidesulfovibrio mexicanus TaxID=147047 RepID=A0A238XWI9_9BACT|nr:methyl-accepting chemotaxis protein [Humidesulfovibrio mexicanus]SNR62938.1 methyl-accepting chemotaxis sensory transducer with Cache sensor [Humidesulfovibrio mexicanus]